MFIKRRKKNTDSLMIYVRNNYLYNLDLLTTYIKGTLSEVDNAVSVHNLLTYDSNTIHITLPNVRKEDMHRQYLDT